MKYSELLKLVAPQGCYKYREGANHEIWKNADGKLMTIPRHKGKEVPDGTLKTIKKWAGI